MKMDYNNEWWVMIITIDDGDGEWWIMMMKYDCGGGERWWRWLWWMVVVDDDGWLWKMKMMDNTDGWWWLMVMYNDRRGGFCHCQLDWIMPPPDCNRHSSFICMFIRKAYHILHLNVNDKNWTKPKHITSTIL